MSRNYLTDKQVEDVTVASREGRVSRNSNTALQTSGYFVASREGRVSRNLEVSRSIAQGYV